MDREAAGLRVDGLAIRGGGPGLAICFCQCEIAQGRHAPDEDERVAVFEVHGGQLPSFAGEPFAGACRDARHIRALPGSRVAHEPAPAGLGGAPEPEQPVAQQIMRGSRAGIDEAPLVLPLRHRLARCRVRDAFVGAPGVLAEQQQVAPHRDARVCAALAAADGVIVARLEAVVPERDQLRRARHELRGPKRRQLGGGRGGAIFPVQAGVAAADGNLRPIAALDIAEEILRAARDDARPRKAASELLDVGDHRFLHKGVVVPIGTVQ